jgi:dihydroorotate dehydrogenase electron transfer subunit
MAIYKVESDPSEESRLALLIKVVGDGTRRLAGVKLGDAIDLIGPLGNGFDLERAKGKINFLVVGGTGIASVYLLAKHLSRYGESVHLVYGGRNADALVGLDDFRRLEIPIVTVTEDASLGFRGLVTDGFLYYLDRFPVSQANIYTCGPNPMMQTVTEIAARHRIPCQISVESKMACGFGVCLGCTVKTTGSYRLACTDGPVFDASEFVWENYRPPTS